MEPQSEQQDKTGAGQPGSGSARNADRRPIEYDRSPRGRGMLQWEGKQAPEPVRDVPVRMLELFDPRSELPLAQLNVAQETDQSPVSFLGQAVPNSLYYGDNRDVLAHLLATGWRGRVKMVYIDPPFGTGGDYVRKVRLRGGRGRVIGQSVEYHDTWTGDTYLQFMYERLFLLRELLADDGSLWLHCDYRQEHRLRLILEEVFGEDNYLNTISWRSQVARGAKVNAFYFPNSTQYIQIFAKNRQARTAWNAQKRRLTFSREQASAQFMEDERGFFRTSDPGTYSFERLKQFHAEGRLYAPYSGEIVIDDENRLVFASNGGNIGIKYYLKRVRKNRYAVERGVDNLWEDIPGLGTTPGEDVGYPTQKTEALLRRALSASTQPGDMVLDCFAGSGTTAAVAHKMGRHWMACDVSYGAIQTTRRRLQRVVQETGPGFTLHTAGQAQPRAASDSAQVAIERSFDRRGAVEVEIMDYRPSRETLETVGATGVSGLESGDWRRWVEAVDVDTAYDGHVFRGLFADLPQRRRDLVIGAYALPGIADEPTTVAVRITDVFGGEQLVTRRI